ncbi:CDP-alcohol phosphatidyltransferase family protein [Alysiella filiformis]|uniref:CDP-diacylglycerol--glycerol-3-phosphate 3-phosphatidyltransferase n=1 Tax=Alysiella filiformis DSM 16848 TaxID=1120981 RepID=A0A286EGP4_9NEIS|nr:CDP-alcohol phosphatidyltransferase family protein [Alysiella filiformis]QMT32158.1 CDP-alcohol phosphatidyltransferase family protein [Alysiella filiformis]UBQ56922.1 CDP-alcohol phosphatidyltransferase family protein [Alysiella filiformis DSM 16848]SOD70092.1 CDP-diacylglycerol--glycerol-3-phosphate 3-phosphatidyltransferase [Alysiella filiformis DSM 16848]
MFSTYAFKPKFQEWVRPMAQKLVQNGITANQVTQFAAIVSVLLGVILSVFAGVSWLFFLQPIWLLLRMILNAIDGIMAREFMQESAQGGYFNEAGDVLADAALYLPFAFVAPLGGFSVGLLIWLAALTEIFGLLGKIHGFNGRRYDGFGKSDRAAVFGVLALWYAFAGSLNVFAHLVIWLMIALSVYTCYLRFQNGLKAKI